VVFETIKVLEERAVDAENGLKESRWRGIWRDNQGKTLDGRASWWKPRDVTLVTSGNVAEASGRALDGRLMCATTQ
jgi:hypothetical protein